MCDPTPVKNWLIAALIAMLLAIGIIVGAAIANGSIWLAYLSPIGLVAAAASGLGAILLLGQAMSALNTFRACAGARCAGVCTNLGNVITATRVVLGIQFSVCAATAAYAWIPFAAQPAIWAIVGAIFVQVALIVSAIAFVAQLLTCQARNS